MAACGLAVGKMSGRGLRFTGGTIDKLESITGWKPELSEAQFRRQLREVGLVVAGQTADLAPALFAAAHEARIELIEQPFPEQDDEILRGMARPVPVCADESLHTRASLPRLPGLYAAMNTKRDKAGGTTEALALNAAARFLGFRIMVGSMVATSLAAAPAILIAQGADWADLDGPLLLARDRDHGIQITNGLMQPPERELWG